MQMLFQADQVLVLMLITFMAIGYKVSKVSTYLGAGREVIY